MIEGIYTALMDALPKGTPLYLGPQYLAQHDTPPRLVLIPRAETLRPPDRPARPGARGVLHRTAALELHIWGRDYGEAESIMEEMATALLRLFGDDVTLVGAEWDDETWERLGVALVLRFTVSRAVVQRERLATLEAIAQECGVYKPRA